MQPNMQLCAGEKNEMVIQDVSAFAAKGELLSFWQLQVRLVLGTICSVDLDLSGGGHMWLIQRPHAVRSVNDHQ